MKLEQLTERLNHIYKYCQATYDDKNGDLISGRLSELSSYLAESSNLLAWAQYYYDKIQGEEAEKLIKEQGQTEIRISPTVFKQLINGRSINESKILKFTERINRTITHQIDILRSQLSYLKSLPQ